MKSLLAIMLPAVALAGGFGGRIEGSAPVRVSSSPVVAKSLIGYGDSIMAGTGGGTPLTTAKAALGPAAVSFNAGVPGDSSGGIRSRWTSGEATACGAARCTHVWFEGGTNDLRAVSPALPADVITNMVFMVDDALSKGYTVVWSDVLPCRGYVDASDAVIDRILAYNALMATACATAPRSLNPRLRCLFGYNAFVDPTRFRDDVALAGYLLPAYSFDELHLSTAGSAALGFMAGQLLP